MMMGMTGTSNSARPKSIEGSSGCPMMSTKENEILNNGGSSGG